MLIQLWGFGMRAIVIIALTSALIAAAPISASAACTEDLAILEKAVGSSSWQEAEKLARDLDDSITCEPWEKTKASGLLSRRFVAEARKSDPDLNDASKIGSLVEKAAKLHADWRALELQGRLLRSAGHFREAAESFQDAINLIADWDSAKSDAPSGAWGNEASSAERSGLVTEADEAKHLAAAGPQGTLVVASTDRAGNPGGVFSAAVDRGAVGVHVPAPILFEFNSAQLTRIGVDAAQEMASFLKDRAARTIRVTGHTDHVGGDAYNIDLSNRRAATVASFLRQNGITAKISTIGKGFSEPRTLSAGSAYTQAQIDELNRRVEFDWN